MSSVIIETDKGTREFGAAVNTKTYALVDATGTVVNTVRVDLSLEAPFKYQAPAGLTMIEATSDTNPRGRHDGTQFVRPAPPEPAPASKPDPVAALRAELVAAGVLPITKTG